MVGCMLAPNGASGLFGTFSQEIDGDLAELIRHDRKQGGVKSRAMEVD